MTDTPDTSSQDRIAKVMARAGLCSRREAEAWIAEGRVTVNGAKLTTPAVTVGPDDKITVDGKPLPVKERTRLWLYHKPRGLVTTAFDPQGRPTVFERLPEGLPRVMSVGRLDINTEGLLLLTNDGGLSRILELPTTGWLRKYRVRAHGQITQAQLDKLKDGVAVDGVLYGGIEAKIDHDQGANIWMTIGLREGKNREIKNVLGSLGMEVSRLIRISFGPFQLGDIPLGEADEVAGRTLRDQLGARLIEAAGADFTSPVNQQPNRAEPGAHPPRQRSRSGGEPTDPKRHGDRPHGRDDAGRAAPGERGGYRGRQTKDGPERPRSAGYRDRPAGARGDRPGAGGSGIAPRSAGYRDRPDSDGGERRGGAGGEGRGPRPGGRFGSNDRPSGGRDEARGPRGAGGGRPGGEGRSGAAPRSAGYRDRPASDGAERRGGAGGEGRGPRPGGRFGSNDRPSGGRDEARGPRGAGPGRPGGGPRGAGGGRPGEGRPRPAPAGASDAPRKTFDRSGLRTPRPEGDRGETGGWPGGRPAGRGGAPGDRPLGRSGTGGSGGRSERPAGGSGGGYRGPGGSGPGRGPGGPGGNRGPRGAGAGGEGRGPGGPGGAGGREKRPGGQGRPGPGGSGGYRGPGGSGPGRGPGGPGGNRGPRKPGGPSGSGPKRGPRS